MDNEQLAVKLQEVTDRAIRNEGRIKKLEGEHEVLHQLATSVAVMAEQLKNMHDSLDTLSGKVGDLEGKPAKRWEQVVDKLIFGIAATGLGAVLTMVISRVLA